MREIAARFGWVGCLGVWMSEVWGGLKKSIGAGGDHAHFTGGYGWWGHHHHRFVCQCTAQGTPPTLTDPKPPAPAPAPAATPSAHQSPVSSG